jgi:hypothetical protein
MAKYKQSETITILRSTIKFAPYNPRKDNKRIVDELKKNFKRVGFLGGIVWNERTGNIVGGHKRVMALDLIHDYDGSLTKDYELKVERVDLDEKTEKEQNIFLNNKRVQGETDYEKLALMLPDIDIDNTGLDEYDISIIETLIPDFSMGDNEDIQVDTQELKKDYNERKEEIKELKKNIKNGVSDHQTATHFTVTFRTYDEKAGFLENIGINGDDVYITAERFKENLFRE